MYNKWRICHQYVFLFPTHLSESLFANPPKQRTGDSCPRMARGSAVFMGPQPQIILLFVHNQGATPKGLWWKIGKPIGTTKRVLGRCMGNVAKVAAVAAATVLARCARPGPVSAWAADVKMVARPLASFSAQIACPVNVKPVLALGNLCEFYS